MTNAGFTDIHQYKDVESLNYFEILKGQGKPEEEVYEILRQRSRDNGRTPMQWDDSPYAGFSTHEPWIPVNENYPQVNTVREMAREDSVWQYYRKLIRLRKEYPVIADGGYRPLLEEHPQIFAYERYTQGESLLAFHNFYAQEAEADLGELETEGYVCLLDNYQERSLEKKLKLKPYESAVFLKK